MYCEVIEGNRLLTAQSGTDDLSDFMLLLEGHLITKTSEVPRVPDYSRRYQACLIHVVFIDESKGSRLNCRPVVVSHSF